MARESTIGSVFLLEKIPSTPATPVPISAGTAAKPAVLTVTGATTAKGEFIRISGTGSKPLDRMVPHRASVATATSITVDTDNSAANNGVAVTDGDYVDLEFQEVCFAEFGNDVPTPGEIDVTTMCDDERRQVTGLASMGTATFGGPLDLTDAGQMALLEAYNDKKPRAMIWKTRSGQTGMLYGVVNSFSGGPQGIEQAVTFKGSFQIMERGRFLPPIV